MNGHKYRQPLKSDFARRLCVFRDDSQTTNYNEPSDLKSVLRSVQTANNIFRKSDVEMSLNPVSGLIIACLEIVAALKHNQRTFKWAQLENTIDISSTQKRITEYKFIQ